MTQTKKNRALAYTFDPTKIVGFKPPNERKALQVNVDGVLETIYVCEGQKINPKKLVKRVREKRRLVRLGILV